MRVSSKMGRQRLRVERRQDWVRVHRVVLETAHFLCLVMPDTRWAYRTLSGACRHNFVRR